MIHRVNLAAMSFEGIKLSKHWYSYSLTYFMAISNFMVSTRCVPLDPFTLNYSSDPSLDDVIAPILSIYYM